MIPVRAEALLGGLIGGTPTARAALLALDGRLVAQAPVGATDGAELAREFALPLAEAQRLTADAGWGAIRGLSLRGDRSRVVFGFLPDGLVLSLAAGPAGLPGRMRQEIARAVAALRRG